ncbi:MAG: glycosyltransferase [Candidatus Hodarchaeota archaeon]
MVDISIIIPIKNIEDPYLPDCLNSLRKQTYFGDFEIIVVEGGNISQARNEGIRNANGDMVAFIDSDCIAPTNWLKKMSDFLISFNNAGGVGGPNISPLNRDILSEAIDDVFGSYLGSLGSTSLYRPKTTKVVKSIACINSIYWREALIQAEGFDERFMLNEDTNLSHRVISKGYNLYFVPDPLVFHHRKNSLEQFSKQFFHYGISRMRSMLTNIEYADPLIIFFLSLFLITPIFVLFYPLLSLLFIVIYLLVVKFIGLNRALKKRRNILLLIIPLLFLIEHLSYAGGLLWGLTKGSWKTIKSNPKIAIYEHI